MTGREKKDWKTWAKNAVAELDAKDDGGPSYIPILPRHGVYLFCVAGDGRRFARLFGQTWRKMPFWARRRLLKHWRAARRERYGDGHEAERGGNPREVAKTQRKTDDSRGESRPYRMGRAGLEPATSCVSSRRSGQLS